MGKLPHMWGQSLYILGNLMAEVREDLKAIPPFVYLFTIVTIIIRLAMNSLNSNNFFILLYFDITAFPLALWHRGMAIT